MRCVTVRLARGLAFSNRIARTPRAHHPELNSLSSAEAHPDHIEPLPEIDGDRDFSRVMWLTNEEIASLMRH
jgi:hypothetical protein